jgi:hypothetical protein
VPVRLDGLVVLRINNNVVIRSISRPTSSLRNWRARQTMAGQKRDHHEGECLALAFVRKSKTLAAFDRYERRATSRRNRRSEQQRFRSRPP